MRKHIKSAFDFWGEAHIDAVIIAAAGIQADKIDARFRAELGEITAFDRACLLGARLAIGHHHYEAGQCPGEWARCGLFVAASPPSGRSRRTTTWGFRFGPSAPT